MKILHHSVVVCHGHAPSFVTRVEAVWNIRTCISAVGKIAGLHANAIKLAAGHLSWSEEKTTNHENQRESIRED